MKENALKREENNVSCIPDLKYVGGGVEKSSFTEGKILYCKMLS